MTAKKPMTPEDKLSISLDHITVIALMRVAAESPTEARQSVEKLSPKACKRLLRAAVDLGGLLLRYDAAACRKTCTPADGSPAFLKYRCSCP